MAPPPPPRPRIRVSELSLMVWVFVIPALAAAGSAVALAVSAVTPLTRDSWWQLLAVLVLLYVAWMMGSEAVRAAFDDARERLAEGGDEVDLALAAPVSAGPPASVVVVRHWVMWRTVLGYLALVAATGLLIWDTPGWDALASEDGEPPDRTMWSLLLLTPGVVLAWAWTWRFGRYLLGMLGTARLVEVEVFVAHLKWTTEPGSTVPLPPGSAGGWPAACWLSVSEPGGLIRYQRVMWTRRLVALTVAAGDRPVAASARRCPGFRRMLLVDVPSLGRLWPTSTARPRPPANYDLGPYDPARMGMRHYLGWIRGDGWASVATTGAALVVSMAMMGLLAGPTGAIHLPVLTAGYWLWQGGVPLGGVYSYTLRPARGAPTHGTQPHRQHKVRDQ